MADSLYLMGQNKRLGKRYAEIVNPVVDDRKPEDIINKIKSKLGGAE